MVHEQHYTIDYRETVPVDMFFDYMFDYADLAFDQLPRWLKDELKYNGYMPEPRPPTDREIWDTVTDAREHRYYNNELTLDDIKAKYIKGRNLAHV